LLITFYVWMYVNACIDDASHRQYVRAHTSIHILMIRMYGCM